MSIGAAIGTAQTAAGIVGEIPVVGDVLSDIPVLGGFFGGGPEDIDASEVTGKLFPGRWSQLDDEMEPTRAGASSAARELESRMQRSPEIREAATTWARDLFQQLQSQDLMQDVRSPSGTSEVANVVSWAAHGGAGSSDWGPAGMEGAQKILDLRPAQFADPGTAGGLGLDLDAPTLIAGGLLLGGSVLLLTGE